jgi:hypothetical protein
VIGGRPGLFRAERWLGLAGLRALAAMLVVGVWRT